MNYTTKIPLEQENIRKIFKSFEDGEFEYFEKYKEHSTVTHNGRGADIWNHINDCLVRYFEEDRFQTFVIDRKFWHLIALYDKDTKYLYTFMRDKNYSRLSKKEKTDQLKHYVGLLSRLNGKLLKTYTPIYQQITWFEEDTVDEEFDVFLQEELNKIVQNIAGEVERYALVLVNQRNGRVKDADCIVPVENILPIYEESWKEHIVPEYQFGDEPVEENREDVSEIRLFTNENYALMPVQEKQEEEKNI